MDISNSTSSSSVADFYAEQAKQRQEQRDRELASGERINSAADDPAGLQIGNRLSSSISEAEAYNRIYQNGIAQNSIQSAGLQATTDILADTQALVVQSGNGIYNSDDIEALQSQMDANIASIENADDLGLTNVDLTDPAAAEAALSAAQVATDRSNSQVGAQSNALASAQSSTQQAIEAQSAARSRILDTDYAQASSDAARDEVLMQSSLSVEKNRQEQAAEHINRLFY